MVPKIWLTCIKLALKLARLTSANLTFQHRLKLSYPVNSQNVKPESDALDLAYIHKVSPGYKKVSPG